MDRSVTEYPMTQATMQFVYKALVVAFIAAFLGVVAALIAAIFHFGDGEAQKIITDLSPVVIGAFGSFALMFLGHQGVTAMQTMAAAGLQTAQLTTSQPTTTPAAPAAQSTPASGATSGAQGH